MGLPELRSESFFHCNDVSLISTDKGIIVYTLDFQIANPPQNTEYNRENFSYQKIG